MKKLAQLLIICCAFVGCLVCLGGCSQEDGIAENAANVIQLKPGQTPESMGYRHVITFGAGAAKAAQAELKSASPAKTSKSDATGPTH